MSSLGRTTLRGIGGHVGIGSSSNPLKESLWGNAKLLAGGPENTRRRDLFPFPDSSKIPPVCVSCSPPECDDLSGLPLEEVVSWFSVGDDKNWRFPCGDGSRG
eukprot:scaffold16447_cov130-Amphora_coffeaeformis.AAC.2